MSQIRGKEKKIIESEFNRQYAAGLRRGARYTLENPQPIDVVYMRGLLHIKLSTGFAFAFDPRKFSELENASNDELKQVRILGFDTIAWDLLDVHLGLGTIITESLGEKYLKSLTASLRGKAKSELKAAASRANGSKGGRPVGSKDSYQRQVKS